MYYLSNLSNTEPIKKKCKVKKGFLPNINPTIMNLSPDTSISNKYSLVYITGENFTRDTTYVIFGSKTDIDIIYYTNNVISFVIPMNYPKGSYNVQVRVVNTITPSFLYSNAFTYVLT